MLRAYGGGLPRAERSAFGAVPPNRRLPAMVALGAGSAGHLGEALVRTLRNAGHEVMGLDVVGGPFTAQVGSIVDRQCVRRCMHGIETVFHSATLHKPHVGTHSRQE